MMQLLVRRFCYFLATYRAEKSQIFLLYQPNYNRKSMIFYVVNRYLYHNQNATTHIQPLALIENQYEINKKNRFLARHYVENYEFPN